MSARNERFAALSFATLGCAAILGFAAAPAMAEPPLTADAFDAMTTGRTMTWAALGTVYGVEEYLPGRRVRWASTGNASTGNASTGNDCVTGHWYPQGDAICFRYEDNDSPACWLMGRAGSALTAFDTAFPPGTPLVLVEDTATPLACPGPQVGS